MSIKLTSNTEAIVFHEGECKYHITLTEYEMETILDGLYSYLSADIQLVGKCVHRHESISDMYTRLKAIRDERGDG